MSFRYCVSMFMVGVVYVTINIVTSSAAPKTKFNSQFGEYVSER